MTSTRSLVGAVDESPDLMAALRRQWVTIVLTALVGALGGWLYSSTQPVVYESKSTLLLIAAGDEATPGGGRDRTLDVDTWATVARSTELLQEVAAELDMGLDDVRTRSTATAAPVGDVLILTFDAPQEDEAIEGAAVYSTLFLEARRVSVNAATVERQQQLGDLASALTVQIADLERQVAAEEAKGELASEGKLNVLVATQQQAIERLAAIDDELGTLDADVDTGRIVIDPQTNVERVGLGVALTTLSGLLVGALVGLILALLRDRYDDRYSSAPEPELFGLREIGRVPYAPERSRRGRAAMLDYSRLITRLTFARRGERSVLLLPIESETLPLDAAQRVASALEEVGLANRNLDRGVVPGRTCRPDTCALGGDGRGCPATQRIARSRTRPRNGTRSVGARNRAGCPGQRHAPDRFGQHPDALGATGTRGPQGCQRRPGRGHRADRNPVPRPA